MDETVPVGMKIPQKTEEEQIQFYNQCKDRFLKATEKTGEIRQYYDIAGTTVCLIFAGEALIPFLAPALAHLRLPDDSEADARIHIWDSESTGVNMVPPPCEQNHYTDRGDIWGFNSDRIKTAFHWSEFSVNVMDLKINDAVYWVKTADNLPYWATSSPFRTIFNWWMEKNGGQLIHAAAVGTEEGAVLITAKGGAGKSTTAVSSLLDGMKYISDDYLIVKKDPVPKVYSLYSTSKIGVGDNHRFPALDEYAAEHIEEDQEKDVIFLYPAFEDQIVKELPVRTILMPNIQPDQEETTFSPISFWRINRAMSFTTMSQLPGAGTHTHEFFHDLCEVVPTMTLNLGSNIKQVPKALRNHLNDSKFNFIEDAAGENREEEKNLPLVSVIIPVYNGEKFIEEAVQNVLDQNYPALEIIIINDGSTDNSGSIIENLDTDVRYFDKDNTGPAMARNFGIKDASGKYIAFLDVDDLWPENNLQHLVRELEENEDLDVVRGFAQLFRDKENGKKEFLGNPRESYKYYIGAALYRASVFSEVGLFDPTLLFGEDTDWHNRAVEKDISTKWLDEVTLFVRRHGENMTEGKNLVELNKLKTIKRALDRKREFEK